MPFGGILADRVNRRNVMLILDFTVTTLLLTFGFTLSLGYEVAQIGIVMSIMTVVHSFYGPAVQAAIPSLQEKENLVAANAVVNQIVMLSNILGPILGGVFYAITGISGLIWMSASVFLVSAIVDIFIKIPFTKQEHTGGVFSIIKNDMSQGFRFIFKEQPDLLKSLGALSAINLLFVSMQVGLPFIILVVLARGSELFGIFSALGAAAGMLGGIFVGITAKRANFKLHFWALAIIGFLIALMGSLFLVNLTNITIFILITGCTMGMYFFASVFNIPFISALQKLTPNHLLGKVMAYVSTIAMATTPIGRLIYGVIFEEFQDNMFVIFSTTGILLAITGIFVRILFKRLAAKTET
jgi:MFS family permease